MPQPIEGPTSQVGLLARIMPAMQKQPSVRASAVRDTLAFLDKFEPGSMKRVLARVPVASREVIDSTPRSGWIHVDHDHFTIDAIVECFGRERAIQFWSAAIAELSDKPLLKAFVGGMFRIVALDPQRIASIFATGWPLVYRDMCMVRAAVSPDGHAALHFEELAPELRKYRSYLFSWHGGCAGFARLAGLNVRVLFEGTAGQDFAQAVLLPVTRVSEPKPSLPMG